MAPRSEAVELLGGGDRTTKFSKPVHDDESSNVSGKIEIEFGLPAAGKGAVASPVRGPHACLRPSAFPGAWLSRPDLEKIA